MSDYHSVTIVSVAYNSTAVMKSMLSSIPKGAQIIVVDNASADVDELQNICSTFNATLLRNDQNRGFGVA